MPNAPDAEPLVTFDGVWKRFRKHYNDYDSLRDFLPAMVSRAFSPRRAAGADPNEFWALRDVSFRVASGEALGIMGPNGAGKSTILKLLTRILRPTSGTCAVKGRVGALIELAAGFHPDLSGRENIYLQGAVMGIRRAEVSRRLAEIVDFSGIPEFIDVPVKNYSSGMHARLGFAIAAHMNPEVLLIDEVLGVGDLAFQKRAMDRIELFARSGIPVIIISHQLERLVALCSKAILLDQGQVVKAGTPSDCVEAYVQSQAFTAAGDSTCSIRLESLERVGPEIVITGDRMSVVLRGTIPDDHHADTEEIILRVRALDTGQILFAIGKESFAAMLPSRGPFALEAALQMNVQPGLYLIESQIRNQDRTQYVGAGPQTHIRVKEGQRFYGMIQMNPRVIPAPPSGTLEPAQQRLPDTIGGDGMLHGSAQPGDHSVGDQKE